MLQFVSHLVPLCFHACFKTSPLLSTVKENIIKKNLKKTWFINSGGSKNYPTRLSVMYRKNLVDCKKKKKSHL